MPQAAPQGLTQSVQGLPGSMQAGEAMRAPYGMPTSLMGTRQGMAPMAMQPGQMLTQTQPVVPTYAPAQMGAPVPYGGMQLPHNPASAPPVRPLAGVPTDIVFQAGDKVQLRGHAANPEYEGKVYVVEAADANGVVMVSHKVMGNAVSRMTFNQAHLELVAAAEDQPMEAQLPQEPVPQEPEQGLQMGDTVQITGLGACPQHDGRLCTVVSADPRQPALRVKFVDSDDMLELAPAYLALVERAKATAGENGRERVGSEGEGGLKVGTQVMILAPPHHRGKVAIVEVPNVGDGSLRVRMQDPSDSVTVLVLSPTHIQNMDGSAVAGTAAAVASQRAQADAIRQAATVPQTQAQGSGSGAVAPLAVAPGERVRVKPSLPAHVGKMGVVEADNDGTGVCAVLLEDGMGGTTRLRINPIHLDLA